jgi:hypothetical protein
VTYALPDEMKLPYRSKTSRSVANKGLRWRQEGPRRKRHLLVNTESWSLKPRYTASRFPTKTGSSSCQRQPASTFQVLDVTFG